MSEVRKLGDSRGKAEGAPCSCGGTSTERSESNPSRSSRERSKVWGGGKSRCEAEGALSAAPGCPAGVCLVAGDLPASSELIFVNFLRLSSSPRGTLGDRRALCPRIRRRHRMWSGGR